jgi:hypothetical protein
MQDQELHLARGDAAKQLLKSEAFMAVTNELVNGYVGSIVQSKPEDTVGRERAYAAVKAVQDMVSVLNQWQSIAAQIRMAAEEDEAADQE